MVDGDVHAEARRLVPDHSVVDVLPLSDPYDLRDLDLVWAVVVADEEGCATVVEGVLRGIDVVVRCDGLPSDLALRFADDLRRAGGLHAVGPVAMSQLDPDQLALLEALGSGVTLASAAASQGMAIRSAHRRLAGARRALGVATTAEAVLAVERRG